MGKAFNLHIPGPVALLHEFVQLIVVSYLDILVPGIERLPASMSAPAATEQADQDGKFFLWHITLTYCDGTRVVARLVNFCEKCQGPWEYQEIDLHYRSDKDDPTSLVRTTYSTDEIEEILEFILKQEGLANDPLLLQAV